MPALLPDLSDELHSLFGSWDALIQDAVFWWEVGVLLLAATGALMIHRALSQSLQEQ